MPKKNKVNRNAKFQNIISPKEILQRKWLLEKLVEGENSGFITNFNRDEYLKTLHQKYL